LGRGWVVVAMRFLSMPPAVLCQAAAFIVGGRDADAIVVDVMLVLMMISMLFVFDVVGFRWPCAVAVRQVLIFFPVLSRCRCN
jgi:hypothetical protein